MWSPSYNHHMLETKRSITLRMRYEPDKHQPKLHNKISILQQHRTYTRWRIHPPSRDGHQVQQAEEERRAVGLYHIHLRECRTSDSWVPDLFSRSAAASRSRPHPPLRHRRLRPSWPSSARLSRKLIGNVAISMECSLVWVSEINYFDFGEYPYAKNE